MVQVQSTWFPVIDRNPQKYVPNIFEAKASDYQKATQRIYRSKQYPSNVEIPVVAQPMSARRFVAPPFRAASRCFVHADERRTPEAAKERNIT